MKNPDFKTRRGTVWVWLEEGATPGSGVFVSTVEPVPYKSQRLAPPAARRYDSAWVCNRIFHELFPDIEMPEGDLDIIQIDGDGTVKGWTYAD